MTSPVRKPPDQAPDALDAGSQTSWDVYAQGVRLIALRALGDVSLADDVAQESIARAIARFQEQGPEAVGNIGAFIHGIARHVIADFLRTKDRTISLDTLADPATAHPDALILAVRKEERQHVRDALSRLSDVDRWILQLSFYEGLRPEEIAQRLNEDVVRIRKRKSRALQRLRKAFVGLGHAEGSESTDI